MADTVNYYDVLGVGKNASQEELRQAYLAKTEQLRSERFVGAPPDVMTAVKQATVRIEQAWHVLGDVWLRGEYDGECDATGTLNEQDDEGRHTWRQRHAEHVWTTEESLGLPLSPVFGLQPPASAASATPPPSTTGLDDPPMIPSEQWLTSPFYDPLSGPERIANWLAPHPKADPNVTVPDVCGMKASDVFYAVARADLHIKFVRLTEQPQGDGIVVDQDPAAGTSARRQSTLTVQVVYNPPTAGDVTAAVGEPDQ